MFHGKVRKQDFSDVYDKISSKLASWKSKLLNKPGRVVLANSVIAALPSYHMQINWLPQSVCDDMDKTVRRFIWKGTGDKGMHLVGWNKITQPRNLGGLGVRRARLQNVALLGKLIWEILQAPNKLWVMLFNDRYLKGQLPFNVKISGGSVIWNSLAKAMHTLRDGFMLKIGDGNSSFWYDSWVFKERLSSIVPFVDIHDTSLKINEVWNNGEWNLQYLYTNIPQYVVDAIKSLQPCIVSDLPDIWTWHNASSGVYSTKDAYTWLLDPMHINNLTGWKWIWQLRIPANIQFFLWQLVHESIPTREILHHRHVCSTNLCPRCSASAETIDHCLFLCDESISVWNMCGLHGIPSSLQSADRISWCKKVEKQHGNIIFIIIWFIWCARNDLVFNHHRERVDTIVAKIHSLVLACAATFNSPDSMGESVVSQRRVSWSRPAAGTVCLNVDGSLLSSKNSAGYGGLLRDNNGDFIWGYYGAATVKNILWAEIMAIWQGLKLCWENGYRKVLCCSDSLLAVTLIRQGVTAHHRFANEIHSIRSMLENEWEVVITHTLREGNAACADVLAKMGAISNSPLVKISTPPRDLLRPLLEDAWGVEFIRE